MRIPADPDRERRRIPRGRGRRAARYVRARSRDAGDGRRRASSLPCRARQPRSSAHHQWIRPASARIGLPPWRSARPADGRPTGKTGSLPGAGAGSPRASGELRGMTAQPDRRLLQDFEQALERDELHMVYQPKVRLETGALTRLEALVRWDRAEVGAVEPSRFVPLAEEHGLIGPLTDWGLRTTLMQWRSWRDEGLDTNVAFNISAISLQELDFPDLVERVCRELEVPTE